MKNIIRKILKEEEGNKAIKSYVTKMFKKQIDSGEIPRINFLGIRRRNLTNHWDTIVKTYFDFVGGEEEAFKLFKKYIEGKIITDEDLRKVGITVYPDDIYEVKISKIYNFFSDDIGNDGLEFGFDLISGQFGTSEGILTLKELYKEKYDDIWVDVRDHMTNEIEDYIWSVCEGNFGLAFSYATGHWA
jgi:hypothetical protein